MDLLSLSDLAKLSAPAPPLPPSDYPLHLELADGDPRSHRQLALIAAGSLVVHFILFLIAIEIPSFVEQSFPEHIVVEHKTPLYFPRELTQKAANRNKVSKEIDLASLEAREEQHSRQASPSPSVRHFEPPQNVGAAPANKTNPRILPEAPNLALNQAPADLGAGAIGGVLPAPPAPRAAPSPLETKGVQAPPSPQIKVAPKPPPPGVARSTSPENQTAPSPALPGIAGQQQQSLVVPELQSDPQGADFKPYLEQILAIVRANWQRVTPEAARSGHLRGRTVAEFIINRDGSVARIVIAQPSGVNLLDIAASSSIVMSSPLPHLPADFKGYQLHVAFRFDYQMPIR